MTTYSQLIYRHVKPPRASELPAEALIAIHGDQGGLDDLMPLARSLGLDGDIFAPEAARGVFLGTTPISRTWFGGSLTRPEPSSFGDSLAQLERFIHDVRERSTGESEVRPWLLGYDQGTVLALSIAAIAPDLVSGVIAVCGGLPTFSDPRLLEVTQSNLPVLLVGDDSERGAQARMIDTTEATLKQHGLQVTVRWIPQAAALGSNVSEELRAWLHRARERP